MANEVSSQSKPSGFLTILRALFFFVLFALIALIWLGRSGPGEKVEDVRAADRVAKRVELEKADRERLGSVGWTDAGKKIVHLPIDQAKELVLADLKAKKVGPSTVKVEAPLPPVAPADPNSTEPAPVALPSSPQGADTLRFDLPAASAATSNSATTEITK